MIENVSQQMAQRKDDHVNLALAQQVTPTASDFDLIRFVHCQ